MRQSLFLCSTLLLAATGLSSAQAPALPPATPVPATSTPVAPMPAPSAPISPVPVITAPVGSNPTGTVPVLPANRLLARLDAPSLPVSLPEAPSALLQASFSSSSSSFQTSTIAGIVQDPSGIILPGATITLITGSTSREPHTNTSAADGTFRFTGIPAGPFQITISAPGLQPWTTSGTLRGSDPVDLGAINLELPVSTADVSVSASTHDVAEAQLQLAEKQRILGLFPNFYASYLGAETAPLTAGQKFRLAARFSLDPTSIAMAATVAGSEHLGNAFPGYGTGILGYTRRFGATYADGVSSTFLGQAIFPALFHQDPRYFVKGTGSLRSRAWYALRSTLTCQGDNGRTQLNISNMLGNLSSAGLSNLYYPASDRRGLSLTFSNAAITTASGALGNLMQEFVLRHFTPGVPDYGSLATGN